MSIRFMSSWRSTTILRRRCRLRGRTKEDCRGTIRWSSLVSWWVISRGKVRSPCRRVAATWTTDPIRQTESVLRRTNHSAKWFSRGTCPTGRGRCSWWCTRFMSWSRCWRCAVMECKKRRVRLGQLSEKEVKCNGFVYKEFKQFG